MALERSRPPLLQPLENGSPLRRGVYLLPNLLTTGGLFSGFYSVVASLHGDFQVAAIAILIANVFDALDGRVARLTRTATRFGIEYDSLADLVAFGVAPAMLIYCWALEPWGSWGWLAAALYLTCAALRLARFNVQFDSVEKRHFVGLPSPAAAEAIAATVLLFYRFGAYGPTDKHLLLLLVTYGLAGLMVSTFPYFSFKETDLLRRQPFWTLLVAIVLLKLLVAEPQVFLFLGFYTYALSGPVRLLWVMGRRMASRRKAHGSAGAAIPATAAEREDARGR
ncbi:MAG: CDP-diacylglycerol--serine O-phosphatidyltransferase [Candidatus Binatia bacterium]|nr:MAG: CDP-diacylglycerol--serine O-phosphatidyltransferase [Candidatus Binatia bacterium]